MASLLRQIVAGPRVRHEDTGLDLCYVNENIIVTSGPSQTYPQRAYRNPLDRLVQFLDKEHGEDWAIWEFRAEGTGYPDKAVYGRIHHFPWPDHHPPPFRLVPMILGGMRNWLAGDDSQATGSSVEETAGISTHTTSEHKTDNGSDEDATISTQDAGKRKVTSGADIVAHSLDEASRTAGQLSVAHAPSKRVAVIHCKAGKGRSGTMSISYLMSELGWSRQDAMERFTSRRMRPGFGPGISIPSQIRWIGYVERWINGGKRYVERKAEVLEVRCWGLRPGVKVEVEGFVEGGRRIEVAHSFMASEKATVENADGEDPRAVIKVTKYGEASLGRDAEKRTPTQSGTSTPTRSRPKLLRKGKTVLMDTFGRSTPTRGGNPKDLSSISLALPSGTSTPTLALDVTPVTMSEDSQSNEDPLESQLTVLHPRKPIVLETSDINICLERRKHASESLNLTMVTAVAHVWFNAFFEGNGPENMSSSPSIPPAETGVFSIDWDAMDGIKGSKRKGVKCLSRLDVVWRLVPEEEERGEEILEPALGEKIEESQPADWKGGNYEDPDKERGLGLMVQKTEGAEGGGEGSCGVSGDNEEGEDGDEKGNAKRLEAVVNAVHGKEMDELHMVKSAGPNGEGRVFGAEPTLETKASANGPGQEVSEDEE